MQLKTKLSDINYRLFICIILYTSIYLEYSGQRISINCIRIFKMKENRLKSERKTMKLLKMVKENSNNTGSMWIFTDFIESYTFLSLILMCICKYCR